MKPDLYTRVILTVIAGCLLFMCALMAGRPLSAQQPLQFSSVRPQPVFVVGWGSVDESGNASLTMQREPNGRRSDPVIPIKVMSVPAGPVDVRLPYSDKAPLPVGLTTIKPAGEWEPIRSAVEPEPTRPRPGGR